MGNFIHLRTDWPALRWRHDAVAESLAAVRYRQGRFIGRMESLGFDSQQQAVLETLTEDAVKTSAIEGERLDAEQVRSSLARRLGMDAAGLPPPDREVEGLVEMLLDATGQFDRPLGEERLFAWHAALFPTGRNGMRRIRAGVWRDDSSGPAQVVSGPIGRERIHFEAPAADRVPQEMRAFLDWFEGPDPRDPVIRAALAHFRFVTIHPFDDGNGRIARALADMLLARSEGTPRRFYSMSAQIRRERPDYYDILERSQKGGVDITHWVEWFLGCLDRAILGAEHTLAAVLRKARFWESVREFPLNERQRAMLARLLGGFDGNLTTSKWAQLARCSGDTALRDIDDLVRRGVLIRGPAGGRSTRYLLVEPRG